MSFLGCFFFDVFWRPVESAWIQRIGEIVTTSLESSRLSAPSSVAFLNH